MVAINITIRVNGFMAPPFARATFYPRHDPRSTFAVTKSRVTNPAFLSSVKK